MDGFFSQAQIKASLFSAVRRRVGKISGEIQVVITAVTSTAERDVRRRQINFRRELPVRIGFAFKLAVFFNVPFLFAVIPITLRFLHDSNFPATDRLAE